MALLFNLRPAMPVVRCAPVSRILHNDTDYANLASRYDGVKIKKRLVKIEGCLNIEYEYENQQLMGVRIRENLW